MLRVFLCLSLVLALAASACRTSSRNLARPMLPEKPKTGDAIVVCGKRFSIGAPVVLWNEAPHYDGYQPALEAHPKAGEAPKSVACYLPGRALLHMDEANEVWLPPQSNDLATLQGFIDQFVLHFDVCGISRTCRSVLAERNLSVHFMLDLDGTLYQTVDLRENCWHATKANWRSIGIEIANMGAYPPGKLSALDEWYAEDTRGPYVRLPARLGDGGIRTPGFVARPARPERIRGEVQGDVLEQYDFTPEQYATLTKLAAALCRIFPGILPDAPRGADGTVLDHALGAEEFERFHGILGHYHVQTNKNDPGPAFDWERFLANVQRELAANSALERAP